MQVMKLAIRELSRRRLALMDEAEATVDEIERLRRRLDEISGTIERLDLVREAMEEAEAAKHQARPG